MTYRYGRFPGDTEDKKVARMTLYRYAKTAPVQGHAITLAGTDPESEVVLMRDYLHWPAKRAWFVDKLNTREITSALALIKTMWGGANVRQSDIRDVIPQLGAVGFANLDFMGAPLGNNSLSCLREIVPLLLPRSVLGFTWIRGREDMSQHLSARRLWRLGKGTRGRERRWTGVIKAVENISKGSLVLVERLEYFSSHSPMAVAIFRKE